jgi:glycosyltransferase involved in cell wall biosynthesis
VFRAALPGVQLNLHIHNESFALLPAERIEPQLRHADHIVTSSSWLTERLRSRVPGLGNRIHTITGGADVRRFNPADPANEQAPDAQDEFRILYVGRISPEKGLHVLAAAFNEVADQNEHAMLEIAGPESLTRASWLRLMQGDDLLRQLDSFYGQTFAERVRHQVLRSGTAYCKAVERQLSAKARKRVRFLGAVPHHELPALYRRAQVFVLPSLRQEPFPLPLTEAMASGLPAVVTRGGATPEIVEAGVTALMVERADATALARALNTLIRNADMRQSMGCAARLRAERLFDWKLAVNRLESLYIRSLEPRAARRARGVHSPVRQA